MKTIFLIAALGMATTAFSQYYPNNSGNMPPPQQYPNNGYGNNNYGNNGYGNNGYGNNGYNNGYGNNGYGNNGYGNNQYNNYDFYDDSFYNYAYNNFPQDYYYNYPTDYYSTAYYNSFYNDYRRSIIGINWNNFFIQFSLNPIQIQQINIINNRFMNFNAWYSYYGMNPNRWYYDRYYMLQRIMGPSIFLSFQNTYYNGMNPMIYFQNYNVSYYRVHYNVMPKYRNVPISNYFVKKDRFFVDNPRYSGFRNGQNITTSSHKESGSLRNNFWALPSENGKGLRGESTLQSGNSGKAGFRENTTTTGNISTGNSGFRNDGFRNNSTPTGEVSANNNGGFRNDGFRNNTTTNGVISANTDGVRNGGFRNNATVNGEVPTNSGIRNGGFRGGSEASPSPRIERDNSSFRMESPRNAPSIERSSGGFRGGNDGGGFRSEGRSSSSGQSSSGRSGGGFR
ncbi:MAG: hypothetical protein JST62_13875 [Bacteroidetes bacterium]|nr:hypothetical protein [Bacteroidota bacterium]